jgi:dienelactone hydrolase
MGRHSQQDVMALTEKVIAALKAQDVTTFGATGYCYGGYVCMQLAHANVAKAVVMSHPTFLQVPVDFEVCLSSWFRTRSHALTSAFSQKLKTQSQTPVFINSCEFDEPFPPEKAKSACLSYPAHNQC